MRAVPTQFTSDVVGRVVAVPMDVAAQVGDAVQLAAVLYAPGHFAGDQQLRRHESSRVIAAGGILNIMFENIGCGMTVTAKDTSVSPIAVGSLVFQEYPPEGAVTSELTLQPGAGHESVLAEVTSLQEFALRRAIGCFPDIDVKRPSRLPRAMKLLAEHEAYIEHTRQLADGLSRLRGRIRLMGSESSALALPQTNARQPLAGSLPRR